MDRIVTLLGIILAVLAAIFSLAALVVNYVPLMLREPILGAPSSSLASAW